MLRLLSMSQKWSKILIRAFANKLLFLHLGVVVFVQEDLTEMTLFLKHLFSYIPRCQLQMIQCILTNGKNLELISDHLFSKLSS